MIWNRVYSVKRTANPDIAAHVDLHTKLAAVHGYSAEAIQQLSPSTAYSYITSI